MRIKRRILHLLQAAVVLVLSLNLAGNSQAGVFAQASDPAVKAGDLLDTLTPEEKIGQLFLVGFTGTDASPASEIYDLIYNRHIGGVVLLAENDNISGEDTINTLYGTISALQQVEWQSAQTVPAEAAIGTQNEPQYIPLFIGISQEGNGFPYDQVISGLNPLPSEMSIGASWNTELARKIGQELGSQLSTLGINLLLGPGLDVLERQDLAAGVNLGTSVFGADPYWVSEMGKAYITGVHSGSGNRIAVIAKHFPGQGSADRVPEDEVATVRKTLEQLKQIEMAPFFAVTGLAKTPEETADGVLVSHIRYQGFQDNIRVTTKPVSLDPALTAILSLPEFQDWHSSGGLVVSSDLGAKAVQQVYDPTGQTFDARRVAREAFLAGNDLLYVNRIVGSGDGDSYNTVLKTLESFITKYQEDAAFAQRVDESVLRILTSKFKVYPQFDVSAVTPAETGVNGLEKASASSQTSFEAARSAVTLISPMPAALPRPPESRERILFITDGETGTQCSTCPVSSLIAVDALQEAVLKLYGPGGTGQVSESRMSSYTYHDLLTLLNSPGAKETVAPLQSDLDYANWIIFSSLNITSDRPDSEALRRFLAERSYMVSAKKVVVFAFGTPYILDATDISKLTAYYALYSKTPAFLEIAARVLFQELTPAGASPVSIPGIGYDLLSATSPDPGQIIPVRLDTTYLQTTPTPDVTPAPQAATFRVGDVLPLQAGTIVDYNGKPIPDNTVVRFIFTLDGGAGGIQQIEALSGAENNPHGKASVIYRISREGQLEIRVESGSASVSEILHLDITSNQSAGITPIVPTQPATETPTPTVTVQPSPTPTATAAVPVASGPDFSDWVLAMLFIGVCGVLTYFGGIWWGSVRWGLRWAICAVLGGLAAYTWVAAGLPGSQNLITNSGTSGLISVTFMGIVLGIVAGLAWRSQLEERLRKIRQG